MVTTLSPVVRDTLALFKARVVASCRDRIREMRLFGSMARGNAHEGSDVDVLVLVDERDLAVVDAIVAAKVEVENEVDAPFTISPLILSQAHFNELRARERRIALDIEQEGIPL